MNFFVKPIFILLISILLTGGFVFISCKKETSCEGCRGNNKPPTAIAGPDQVITLPTDSISLDGSASSDPDGTISEWLWKKISGPAGFHIVNAVMVKTVVRDLDTGVYRFELNVKDNDGLLAKDTVQITVIDRSQPNRPPVANAGADQTIILPVNTANLNGSASTDPDNNIDSYLWTKISGPSVPMITSANAVQTQATSLVQGVYLFELKVTDNGGLSARDTVQITVNAQPSVSCFSSSLPCVNGSRPMINVALTPLDTLSALRSCISVASAGNKILFAGGMVREIPGSTLNIYTSRVDIYDINTATWSTAELSLARFDIAIAAIGSKIFFGGGENGDGSYCSDVVDIYDASTNQWSVASLSTPRNGAAGAAVGTKVFFAGGCAHSNTVDIYDLATNQWSTAVLSQGRNYPVAVTANNKVFFAGGEWFNGPGVFGPSDRIDIYDNLSNSWSTCTLVEPKLFLGGMTSGYRIFWAGGTNGITGLSGLVEIEDLNAGNRTICHLSSAVSFYPNCGQNPVMKDNKIIFQVAPDKIDIYDLTTDTWSIGLLPVQITGASFISVNNIIYIAGGFVNGVQSKQVWKLEF